LGVTPIGAGAMAARIWSASGSGKIIGLDSGNRRERLWEFGTASATTRPSTADAAGEAAFL